MALSLPIQSLMLKLPSISSTLQKTTLQLMFSTINASRSLLRMKKGSLRFKKLRRLLQRKRHIKIVLCVRLSVIRLFQVGNVVQTTRSVLSLASHEWFLRRGEKKERYSACGSRCCQNFKYEIFTSSFGRLRQQIAPKSVPHVQHDYFSSFNQSNHWFVALSLTLQSSNLKDEGNGNGNDDSRKQWFDWLNVEE